MSSCADAPSPDFESFEAWWRHPEYGFELFCEPYVGDLVAFVDDQAVKERSSEMLLRVSLLADKDIILRDFKRILSNFRLGKTDILIGTQMISKGLDFERVELVGIFERTSRRRALRDGRRQRAFHSRNHRLRPLPSPPTRR